LKSRRFRARETFGRRDRNTNRRDRLREIRDSFLGDLRQRVEPIPVGDTGEFVRILVLRTRGRKPISAFVERRWLKERAYGKIIFYLTCPRYPGQRRVKTTAIKWPHVEALALEMNSVLA